MYTILPTYTWPFKDTLHFLVITKLLISGLYRDLPKSNKGHRSYIPTLGISAPSIMLIRAVAQKVIS